MSTLKRLSLLIVGYLLTSHQLAYAQKVPYLDRLISIPESKQSLSSYFKIISAQSSVMFSYTPMFNDKQELKYKCRNKPLRTVLNDLLQTTGCYYRLKDRYIIIKCAAKPPEKKVHITGYIFNAADSSYISEASIYIKQLKLASISNQYGFFELAVAQNQQNVGISIAKQNFRDTAITFQVKSNQTIFVFLNPVPSKRDSVKVSPAVNSSDEIEKHPLDSGISAISDTSNFWKRLRKKNVNIRNINDTLFTRFSVSLLPNIGTNNLLSINTKNKYSFNILAGYSKGIDRFELGGLLNIDNGNVKYAQIGGLANIVAGNMLGAQVAGLLNSNNGQMKGVQIGGLLNLNKKNLQGVSIAGIGNITSSYTHGVQLGGIFNYNSARIKGVQVAGIATYTNQFCHGVQLAGIINYSKNHHGVQLASIVNKTDTLRGVQVSAFFNKASFVKGTQIALINRADTFIGVPFGFFSYVKKGYHPLEIGIDELGIATLSYSTGVNKLHNIFTLGIYTPQLRYLTIGYGFGSEFKISKRWKFSTSAVSHLLQSTQTNTFKVNTLSKLFSGLEYQLTSKISVGAGPTLSLLSSDKEDAHFVDFFQDLPPYSLKSYTYKTTVSALWVGAKAYIEVK